MSTLFDYLIGRVRTRGIEQAKGVGLNLRAPLRSTFNESTNFNDITIQGLSASSLGSEVRQSTTYAPVFTIRRSVTASDGAVLQLVAGALQPFFILEARVGVETSTASGTVRFYEDSGLVTPIGAALTADIDDTLVSETYVTAPLIDTGGDVFISRAGSAPTDIECQVTLFCVPA